MLAIVELEYLEDVGSKTPRVLLLYGREPNNAALLRQVIAPLVAGDTERQIAIESLRGFHGVDGCSLVAEVGDSNLGVEPIEGRAPAFRCVLTAVGWSQLSGLLEPFAATDPQIGLDVHQYLTSDGSVEWIISTSRHW
jgi:hypothetical protein